MDILPLFVTNHYDQTDIGIEFVVIHYSATSLDGVVRIFADERLKVSAHFVISEQGTVYEIVPCLRGQVCKAWHAGNSHWSQAGKHWEHFNNFSIGVELINRNGNLFSYAPAQMNALAELLGVLQQKFAPLKDPARIIGHEQIAGYRGKADPGILFDWQWVFDACYPNHQRPARPCALPVELAAILGEDLQTCAGMGTSDDLFWQQISSFMEACVRWENTRKSDAPFSFGPGNG